MTTNEVATYATLLGFIITIVGFGVTIYKLLKTNKLVVEAKEQLLKRDLLQELNDVIHHIELIKQAPESGANAFICSQLIRKLTKFIEMYPKLANKQKGIIKECQYDVKEMEIEFRYGESSNMYITKLVGHADKLEQLILQFQKSLGEKNE
jgi:hypothetical protein